MQKPIPKPPITPAEELYYQAIGHIFGKVRYRKIEKRVYFSVQLDETWYYLTAAPALQYRLLKHCLANPYSELWFKCYPQYNFKNQQTWFRAVCFWSTPPEEVQDRVFLLKGIWQKIPLFKGNYFSVYRNYPCPVERFKNLHLPLNWQREPWAPSKENKTKAKFNVIQTTFKDGVYSHLKTLSESDKQPKKARRLKPTFDAAHQPQHPPKDEPESRSQLIVLRLGARA